MYELFVLGELMTGDKHGYMLQDVLKNAIGFVRKISSGTLYPLLSRLTENGCIQLRTEEETEGGRTRKIYGITDKGRRRFRELMELPLEAFAEADAELAFRFKMVYFQYVPKKIRLASLEQYLSSVRRNLGQSAEFEAFLNARKPEPEKQRIQLLRVLDHRKRLCETDIRWLEEEIERVRGTEE
ncbi:PadR family transcriptional regulator [Paenibacillaceae bacterium WGS1546]|uniref:PadR family transcriptional regulator n=1 Tax=Cohnella sp. WGS1546 TaxID=3366810 RepID=UPI00372D3978